MPWTVGDVDKHKKGLAPGQKTKWVGIANSVLAECQKQKGSDCEGKAIRIANSKFEDPGNSEYQLGIKIPTHSLNLVDADCLAKVVAIGDREDSYQLDMTCYSGGVIKNHWYWGDLAIDLSGMVFPKSKYPILEDHDTGRKIAVMKRPVVTDEMKLKVDPDSVKFMDTDQASEFINLSKQGFPYESSIRAYPSRYQRLAEGEEAEVNGFTMKGPGTIWRKSTFKEVSVCVFGWDDKTQAKVLSEGNTDEIKLDVEVLSSFCADQNCTITENVEGGKEQMTLDELREKHPALAEQLKREGALEVTATLSIENEQSKVKITDLEKNNTVLEQKVAILEGQLSEIGNREFMLGVNSKVERVWKDALTKSKIPATMFMKDEEYIQDNKVSKHVDVGKFISNGVFNENSFAEAVKVEVADWESRFKGFSNGATEVLGMGFSGRVIVSGQFSDAPIGSALSADDNDWIKKVAALSQSGKKPMSEVGNA